MEEGISKLRDRNLEMTQIEKKRKLSSFKKVKKKIKNKKVKKSYENYSTPLGRETLG